jgi:hypothetical protein
VIRFVSIFAFLWSISAQPGDVSSLSSQSVEFFRTNVKQEAWSPTGRGVVTLLPPANEDADPQMEIAFGRERVALGDLRRSASVFWRPDGLAAVLWDRAFSDHHFVRLVRTRPAVSEAKGFDELVKRRVRKQFHAGPFVHYWPHVQGWTKQNELIVVVCADAIPPGIPTNENTRLVGFERGYVIDTDKEEIRSEFVHSEFHQAVGSDPCQ